MDLVGWDTCLFDVGPVVGGSVQRFAEAMEHRWPDAIISLGWGHEGLKTTDLSKVMSEVKEADAMFFVRDAQMATHMEEFSYEPMTDGEGAVAVTFRPFGDRSLYMRQDALRPFDPDADRGKENLHLSDDKAAHLYPLLPPEGAATITLITPADPELGGFSGEILALLRAAIG